MTVETLHLHDETKVIIAPPTTIEALFEGSIPRQPIYKPKDTEKFYDSLSKAPLYPYMLETQAGREIVAASVPLRGRELTYTFHFAAPSKQFGVDAGDTRSDWDKLFTSPYNAARLEAHRRIAGWPQYEVHKDALLDLIETDYSKKDGPHGFVIPVIRLKETTDGWKWKFEDVPSSLRDQLLPNYPDTQAYPRSLHPILGPLLVAAFNPAVTQSWGERRTYTRKASGYEAGSQDMGSTQVLPLSIGLAPTLLETPVVRNLVDHTTTHAAA